MFKADPTALALTKEAIAKGIDVSLSSNIERIFLYMPLQHSEALEDVTLATKYFSELNQSAPAPQKERFTSLYQGCLQHENIIKSFGRYPYRNELLNRETTPEETVFLKKFMKRSKFMQSVLPNNPNNKKKIVITKEEKAKLRNKLKMLVFHSFRQNAQIMKGRTGKLRKALGDVAELIYVNAPIAYEPSGDLKDITLQAFGKLPATEHQRCFWNANEDNTVYKGVDFSINYLNDLFAAQGPIDGVIAFSHGGAMGAILSKLQPLHSISFRFGVFISAFKPRSLDYKDKFTPNSIDLPSLHVVGLKDILVDPERSRELATCFVNPETVEHYGGHFAPDAWPVEAITKFVTRFAKNVELEDIPKNPENVEIADFNAKIEATLLALDTIGKPIGISKLARERLLTHPTWIKWMTNDAKVETVELRDWVQEARDAATSPEQEKTLLEDLFTIGLSSRVRSYKLTQNNLTKNPEIFRRNDLFYSLFVEIALVNEELAYGFLDQLPKLTSWRDYVGIVVAAHRRAPLLEQLNQPNKDVLAEKLKQLRERIITLFVFQLQKDLQLLAVNNQNDDQGKQVNASGVPLPKGVMPSTCALGAPRLDTAPDRECRIARDIARKLYPTANADTDTVARGKCYNKYRLAVSRLSNILNETTTRTLSRKEAKRKDLMISEGHWKNKIAVTSAIPDPVVNPEPEPVTVAPLEELEPLLEFLKSKTDVHSQTAFKRGTITTDGRLDLCKQVVGSTGIKPLLDAMEGNEAVKKLLLGNNVVGNVGAKAIAEFIRNGAKLTTWYIAGNEIDAEGIQPVCEALHHHPLVNQLWLKRNPLRPEGAVHIANLIRNNSVLLVIDLVNTGLLDKGIQTIFEALPSNNTIRHLYVGSNGVTEEGAVYIAKYLKHHNKLHSLGVSLNRLGDKGAEIIADALKDDKTLERLSIASNRLSHVGATAIAEVVKHHPSLRYLDFGFTKATSVLGELGNIMGDEGAKSIGEMLKVNKTLRGLDLLHNGIGQVGLQHVKEGLKENTTLVNLVTTQFGKVHNEITKEEIKHYLQRNRSLVSSKEELDEIDKLELPEHIAEVYSVYRTHM
eukprot:TRINITY_DN3420_c0_g1_i1.p1 TRINITY_DN3420_c0_g1~~TRINITY_DN3420_c0_g1_i1.p1  ORF type:complete len:1127 (+),score=293.80 TRINITY_DN3420_c0_g1_i1:148-3381(+)